MSVISWEEPPPDRRHATGKPSKWLKIAQALREQPGQWAHVDTRPRPNIAAATANGINRGIYGGMPVGDFEAVSRIVDGQARVYVRYIGGGAS